MSRGEYPTKSVHGETKERKQLVNIHNEDFGVNVYEDGSVELYQLTCEPNQRGLVIKTHVSKMANLRSVANMAGLVWDTLEAKSQG